MSKKMKLVLALVAVIAVAAIALAAAFASQKSDLATKLRIAEGKLTSAQNELQTEKNAHEADVAGKQAELDAEAAAHAEAQAALVALQAEKDAADEAHKGEAEANATALAAAQAELDGEKAAHEETKTALAAVQEAHQLLQDEKAALGGQYAELTAKADALAADVEALNAALAEEKTAHEVTNTQLIAREEELAAAQAEIAELKEAQERVNFLLFADSDKVSITLRIFDGAGLKIFAGKLPLGEEDATLVRELMAVHEDLKFTLRIIEGAGATAELKSITVDRAVVEKLLAE